MKFHTLSSQVNLSRFTKDAWTDVLAEFLAFVTWSAACSSTLTIQKEKIRMFIPNSIINQAKKEDHRPILIVSKAKHAPSLLHLCPFHRKHIESQSFLPKLVGTLKKYRLIILDLVTANYELERIRKVAAQCSVIINIGVADSSLARSYFNVGAVDCVQSLADGFRSANVMTAGGAA